jgi:hypothetical protein
MAWSVSTQRISTIVCEETGMAAVEATNARAMIIFDMSAS